MIYLATILTTLAVTVASILGAVRYLPMSSVGFDVQPTDKLGAFTDLDLDDTMSDFPTLYNANLVKAMEKATTTLYEVTTANSITSASALATVGTITSGTWNATAIAVGKGGTGTTTPSINQVLLGNTTSGIKTVTGYGSSGQFLTSNGNDAAPTWQTSSVNQADTYTWTGAHTFNTATTTLNATTSIAMTSDNPLRLNGVNYNIVSTEGASSTVLMTNGSGALTWNVVEDVVSRSFMATSTIKDTAVTDDTTETSYTGGTLYTIPANLLGTSGGFTAKLGISSLSDSGANTTITYRLKLGGTTVCNLTIAPTAASIIGFIDFTFWNIGVNTSQRCISQAILTDNSTGKHDSSLGNSSSAINTATDQALTITAQWAGNDGDTETTTMDYGIIKFLGQQ